MGWITSFIFLYGALYLFERNRVQLDWFLVLVVALVPALVYLLKIFVTMLVALPPLVDSILWLMTYPIVFLLLWKMMGVEKLRSVIYSAALLIFDIAILSLISVLVSNS
jgi:hypothetical protein